VGKLRSHADKQVSELAKEIVKKWKTEVDKGKRATSTPEATKPTPGTLFFEPSTHPLNRTQ
jgi:transcription elongation factor S-II